MIDLYRVILAIMQFAVIIGFISFIGLAICEVVIDIKRYK